MKIVKISLETDYDKCCRVWKDRSFPIVSKKLLNEYGYAIQDNDEFISFCFLYMAKGSKLCWIGFPTTNPNYEKDLRANSLDHLLLGVIQIAKEMDYDTIMTTTGTKQIVDRLNKLDFTLTDENVGLYFRSI